MTSDWDMFTRPAALRREDVASSEPSPPEPERPDSSVPGRRGSTNGGAAPAGALAPPPDRYLAPARQAAAAARARTAFIRAGQPPASPTTAPQRSPEGFAERPRASVTTLPAGPDLQPGRATAGAATATTDAGARGLSVAAAARASTVAFRPLPRPPEELAQAGSPEPAQQRFARTIAALERYQAASRERGPEGTTDDQAEPGIVPRPALRRPDPATGGSPWSRLWRLRKDAAAE